MRQALRYLPTFVAVLEAGGVRAASSTLHKTQAAISYDLKQLQDIMGVSLLIRSGRELQPTEAGRRLLAASQRMLQDLSTAIGTPANSTEPMRVASVPGFGRYVAHRMLIACADERSVELRFYTNEEVMERVRIGQVDFGFCFAERPSRTLVFQPFHHEDMALIVPPRWCGEPPVRKWKDLIAAKPVVSYDECDFVFAQWFAATYGDPRRSMIAGDHYSELEEVIQAVASGRGFSIVPLDAVAALAKLAPVTVIKTKPVVRNVVYAVYRSDRPDAIAMLPASPIRP